MTHYLQKFIMCIKCKNQIQSVSLHIKTVVNKKVNTMEKSMTNTLKALLFLTLAYIVAGCSSATLPPAKIHQSTTTDVDSYKYLIGAGDVVNIFVWRNPEVSGTFIVRPDGMITTSLVEDIPVSGKTPTELARSIEQILATYLRDPVVTVTVNDFVGPFSEQIRVIGEATEPQAVNYIQHMTL